MEKIQSVIRFILFFFHILMKYLSVYCHSSSPAASAWVALL